MMLLLNVAIACLLFKFKFELCRKASVTDSNCGISSTSSSIVVCTNITIMLGLVLILEKICGKRRDPLIYFLLLLLRIFCLVRFPKPLALLYFALIVLFTDSFPREYLLQSQEQVRYRLLEGIESKLASLLSCHCYLNSTDYFIFTLIKSSSSSRL